MLLIEFHRRFGFWCACTDGAPIEWAGKHLLGLKKRRSYEIYEEIKASTDPLRWFRAQVFEGMRTRRIGLGRETESSKVADAFFTVFAGGGEAIDEIRVLLSGNGRVNITDTDKWLGFIESEVRDYIVYSNAFWRDDP